MSILITLIVLDALVRAIIQYKEIKGVQTENKKQYWIVNDMIYVKSHKKSTKKKDVK